MPADARVYVITGLIAGYQYGTMDEHIRASERLSDGIIERTIPSQGGYASEAAIDALNSPSFSKSFGTYADEVTDFYRDHPASYVVVAAVVGCLADKAEASCSHLGSL